MVSQVLLNGLIAGSEYLLIAIGFNLMYGTTKFFNFAHGTVAAIGAYAVLYATQYLHIGTPVSIGMGIAGAGLCGYVFEKTVFSPIRRRKGSPFVLIIASIGIATAGEAAIALLFGSQFRLLAQDFFPETAYAVAGGTVTAVQATVIAMAAGATI